MARVICKLPNAATVMIVGAPSGSREVKFSEDRKQMISEEVPDDVAEHLASIPGFVAVAAKGKPPKETDSEKTAREAREQAEREQAEPDAEGNGAS